MQIIKASEHGLGLYYRPKEGRDSGCDVPAWIKEGWEWILSNALGLPWDEPDWFRLPVMRRIAISTQAAPDSSSRYAMRSGKVSRLRSS